ncbi:MAG: carbohydrate ABC transporter permease [Planctomycetota bacterium]
MSPARRARFPVTAFEIAMLIAGLAWVSPAILALVNSVKTNAEIIRSPLALPEGAGAGWVEWLLLCFVVVLAAAATVLRSRLEKMGLALALTIADRCRRARTISLIAASCSLPVLVGGLAWCALASEPPGAVRAVTFVALCVTTISGSLVIPLPGGSYRRRLYLALGVFAAALVVKVASRLNIDSYAFIFTGMGLARPMLNSLLMTAAVILCLITIGPMAAYSITRRRMASGRFLRAFFLLGLVIPFQVIMIPLVKLFMMLGIENTYFALLVHYVSWGLPLCIFIYGAFMTTIPRSLEEAAAIDGCGPFALFWRIIFPLLRPCTTTVVIFWGLWIWNDFIQAFIVMGPYKGQLAFVQLYGFLQDKYVKNWSHLFAGAVMLSLPVTVMYVLMQRRFVKGLTAGAVKE